MPSYEQAAFVPRAIGSLLAQTLADWELVVVDDGSPDDTAGAVEPFLADSRVTYHRLAENRGLGAALNVGLARSHGALVAYLPSDDVLFSDHLEALAALVEDGAVLARSRSRPDTQELQLVQAMHRRGPDRWVERPELETDDLERLFFSQFRSRGRLAETGRVTCEWTAHPRQRHRAIREGLDGGLNVFRSRYRVRTPLRFQASDGAFADEVTRYARARSCRLPPRAPDGLRILLVGELAFNPDRILLLAERGHELHGLWTDEPLGFMTVGPLPFGGVRDVPAHRWRGVVDELRPDVVYALLNWRAVPLAHAVLSARPGLPFVWHFKEAPQRSLARGEWPLLADLVTGADACIFSSTEERAWFAATLPGRLDGRRTFVVDGDLPRREWLEGEPSARLSEGDGEIHTVLAGRPYGFNDALVDGLRARGVRLHVHCGPSSVPPEDWVPTLSHYDAGWLHPLRSRNGGDVRRATWDDLNLPARIPMLLAGGLPLIAPRSAGAVNAAQAFATRTGAGLLYADLDDLVVQLRDRAAMRRRREAALAARREAAFDAHVDGLIQVLRDAAAR
jgi:Glycosyl transferase family 2